MSDPLTILFSALSSLPLSGGLIWLYRDWISERIKGSIQHEYNQKLETHKAQLRSQSEIELARLKAQLEIAAGERNVQYSRVFEKTAEIIAETYGKLLALKDAADDYTQLMDPSDPSRQELREAYRQKTQDFLKYFLPKKIYLPKETAEKIRVFSNTVHSATMQFSMAIAVGRGQTRDPETYGKLFDKFFKSSEEVPKLLAMLEDDFQKLLGFGIEEKTAKPQLPQS